MKNKKYHKKTHMFGFELPKTVHDAIPIDGENGDTLWQDAIKEEMQAVSIAFDVIEDDQNLPPGYQEIKCHLIFTNKMEDFCRKARLVPRGHETEPPSSITFASVVSRETVCIALTLAALNDLEVKASDIQNAYLTAPNAEKIWTCLGPEHGTNSGKHAIITRALYGLKSARALFRNHLTDSPYNSDHSDNENVPPSHP